MIFAGADLSDDAFLGGRLHLWQPRKGYRAATDPVLLAAACPALAGQSVLDLGCGAGAAALCLATRVKGLTLSGLELQPAYADLARRNAARNGVDFTVIDGTLTAMPAELRHGFDLVIANPPYYPRRSTGSADASRDTAMRAETPLHDWVRAAAKRLLPGGWLTLICGTDGLPEVLTALSPGLGSANLLPLAPRENRAAPRFILRARKGGRAAFRLLAPLILHQGDHHDGDRESYTPRARAVLRDAADLCDLFA